MSLGSAGKLFPRGRKGCTPTRACIWKWIDSGSGGVRLNAVRIGRSWFTTRAWVERFIAEQNAPPAPTHRNLRPRLPSHEDAERRLAEL